MKNQTDEQIGYHGALASTPIRIAEKYNFCTEGIKKINCHSDIMQAQDYVLKRIKEKYPNAKIKWNPKLKSMVIDLWTNRDGDQFGFVKFETRDAKYNDTLSTTFRILNLTTKLF
jgi:hypothetical protein